MIVKYIKNESKSYNPEKKYRKVKNSKKIGAIHQLPL